MVEGFEKVPLEEMILSKITEVPLKKLFIRINFLVICQVGMLQKSLGPLGPLQLANMWKIKLQKPVFTVIAKFQFFSHVFPVVWFHHGVCFLFLMKKLQSSCLQKECCLFWAFVTFWHSYGWNKKECMLQNFLTHIETMLNLWRSQNHSQNIWSKL